MSCNFKLVYGTYWCGETPSTQHVAFFHFHDAPTDIWKPECLKTPSRVQNPSPPLMRPRNYFPPEKPYMQKAGNKAYCNFVLDTK